MLERMMRFIGNSRHCDRWKIASVATLWYAAIHFKILRKVAGDLGARSNLSCRRPFDGAWGKFYGLIEFPYPSGEGLHVGHPRSYTAIDIMTRKRRMEGRTSSIPLVGTPSTSNGKLAIKHHVKPQKATKKNITSFTRQLKSLGFGFDWSREVNTTDPAYYKWTQWMFLKFFNSYFDEIAGRARPIDELPIPEDVGRGLPRPRLRTHGTRTRHSRIQNSHRMAYKAESAINWCPLAKSVLRKKKRRAAFASGAAHLLKSGANRNG